VTLAETIRELTAGHIRGGGIALGQCLTAVGWVQNTVPSDSDLRHGLVELPMTEGAGAGFAVGAALVRPTILIIRFQSFLWLQASPIVNYAAKCRSIWNRDCRLFVRAIATDNSGPIHSGYHDRIFDGVEGLTVARPHTPAEYRDLWDRWRRTGDPVICSEHRNDYANE
jgi:acetoin:2,6-dichlorophenolindophenol oxidoreductase subunit beta